MIWYFPAAGHWYICKVCKGNWFFRPINQLNSWNPLQLSRFRPFFHQNCPPEFVKIHYYGLSAYLRDCHQELLNYRYPLNRHDYHHNLHLQLWAFQLIYPNLSSLSRRRRSRRSIIIHFHNRRSINWFTTILILFWGIVFRRSTSYYYTWQLLLWFFLGIWAGIKDIKLTNVYDNLYEEIIRLLLTTVR